MFPTADGDGFADMTFLVRAFQVSSMVHVAASLELADRVADGPRPATTLASECGADASMLLRLCRALASFGIFGVDDDDQVSQTTRSAWLRQTSTPTMYHAARYWARPHQVKAWADLEHTVRSGECAFDHVYSMSAFEYFNANPAEATFFNLFMQHSPDDRHAAVAAAYDFSDGLIVDVGGGNGALLAAILRSNSKASGLLFDRESVVANARQSLGELALSSRCRVEAGDFFRAVPPGGDIYTLSQILHDWNDKQCATILANCRAAMEAGQRLLVIERVLESEPERMNPINYLADIVMMANNYGRERTCREYERLLGESGFGKPRIVSTTSAFGIVEAISV